MLLKICVKFAKLFPFVALYDELHRRHGIFPPKALDGKMSFSATISLCTLHARNVKRCGVCGRRDKKV